MNIVFHPEVAEEFEAAVDWYKARKTGLGLDFAIEVNAAIHRAAAMPDAWTRLSGTRDKRKPQPVFRWGFPYSGHPYPWQMPVLHAARLKIDIGLRSQEKR